MTSTPLSASFPCPIDYYATGPKDTITWYDALPYSSLTGTYTPAKQTITYYRLGSSKSYELSDQVTSKATICGLETISLKASTVVEYRLSRDGS
jgi:hypothetical protein